MGDSTNDAALFPPPSLSRRLIINPLKRFFNFIWHVLAYIVGGVIIGGLLVNVLVSLATTGSSGLTDPTTWTISQPILAYPIYALAALAGLVCIGTIAYIAHLSTDTGPEKIPEWMLRDYGLSLVPRSIPTQKMIPFYRPTVYIRRRLKDSSADADAFAQETLAAAAARQEASRYAGQVGICVVGRNLLGSTRLAWEALQHAPALSTWTFVRWHENATQSVDLWQTLQQYRAKVVIWLDDLAKYQDERNASLIARLPYDLEERHIPFIIVATLHEDKLGEIHTPFGGLLDHLVQVRPSDLSAAEANTLIELLKGAGDTVYPADRFDGTPGSIVLAVDYMSNQVFPRLPDSAKDVLRTIKLLRSAGIRQYSFERTLNTATNLFNHKQADGTRDLETLRGAGFLGQSVLDNGRLVLLEPIAEVYLDIAVPDYSDPDAAMADWPKLERSFAQAQDAYALVRLGNAFRRASDDEPAERCYQSALRTLTRGAAPQDWAMAQYGLGDVLSRRVLSSEESKARKLLERAEEAFDRALQVITIDNDRGFWAEIDLRLAEVRRLQASTTVGLEERLKLLDEATKSCRDVLKILRKDTESEEWADAQATLGLVLYNHAQLVKDAGARRHMFDSALEALSAALKILTPENQPFKWTRAQRALGDTSRLRSEVSNRDNKKALLRQAVEAYTRALSPVRRLPYWQPLEQAEILDVLSACAFTLGMLFDGTARAEQMLDAATRSQASAELYAGQHLPERAVQAVHNFAKARNEWALVDSDDSGNELLVEAIEVTANALSYLSGQPTDEAKRMRAYIHLDLAQLYWARANLRDQRPAMAIENDIETTIKYADLALDYFTRDNGSTEYQQAGRIRRNAQAKARAVAPSTDTTATAD